MSSPEPTQIRLFCDYMKPGVLVDVSTRSKPGVWRGPNFEVAGAIYRDGELQDLTAIASVTLEIKSAGPSGSAPNPAVIPILSLTIENADLDNTTTDKTWRNGSQEHFLFEITAAQSAALPACDLWFVLTAVSTDGTPEDYTLIAGIVSILESGTWPVNPDSIYAGTYITPVMRLDLTGEAGTASNDLGGVLTASVPIGTVWFLIIGGVLRPWQMQTDSVGTGEAVIAGTDFNSSTNAKAWHLLKTSNYM